MSDANRPGKTLAIAILFLVSMLDIALWRMSSPFVSETYISTIAVVVTGIVVITASLIIILRWNGLLWPAVWASVGALCGTSQTMATFTGTGGFQVIDGHVQYTSEALQKPNAGPTYVFIGIVVGLLLYFLGLTIRSVITHHSRSQ